MFWGGLHGAYLVINNLFISLIKFLKLDFLREFKIYKGIAWGTTFLCVGIAWVFFRAETFDCATRILEGLFFKNGIAIPSQLANLLPAFIRTKINIVGNLTLAGNATLLGFIFETIVLFASFLITFFTPGMTELSNRWKYVLIFVTFALSLQKVLFGMEMSEFIYFQF